MFCLRPRLTEAPQGDWFGPCCAALGAGNDNVTAGSAPEKVASKRKAKQPRAEAGRNRAGGQQKKVKASARTAKASSPKAARGGKRANSKGEREDATAADEHAFDVYFADLQGAMIIDAEHFGGIARFANHCCWPNCIMQVGSDHSCCALWANRCFTHHPVLIKVVCLCYRSGLCQKWMVQGEPRLMMITTRPVEAYEELTYNYGMDESKTDSSQYRQQVCMCGSPTCCGVVGGKSDNHEMSTLVTNIQAALDVVKSTTDPSVRTGGDGPGGSDSETISAEHLSELCEQAHDSGRIFWIYA